MYFANTTNKRGKKRHHAIGMTRQHAAAKVFNLDPKANSCSTSRAHEQPDGLLWDTGADMQWHNRNEIIIVTEQPA